ncbi:glycine/D-amino acid oxidase-like deaminating enzyme [Nocardia tenerifensis]|uniref:Glycine/D-amino acid oxidase-like deaminating enzyme n=1 Tax=Nocardia tenerifensis TaxID=228006 RepID=A0A318K3V5_9NOCA|nr:FAD-dependent oxidoreductase [Nocardia tenerifensis]PXX57419.1 glycine/D-amino acid oxidase-like deaminating enzyme [Nocardia tenerifensis]
MSSLWLNDAEVPARLRLTPGSRFDTVVIGGGLTGLVTAVLLAEKGVEVAVVEGRRVGAGTTGATTGKISLLQGTRAQRIRRHHSAGTLRDYVAANREGQQWLLRFCSEHGVPIQHAAAFTYAQSKSEIAAVRAEFDATREAGLPTEFVERLNVPFPAYGAVRLADQAQVDPMAVLAALAAEVESHAAPIYESTMVRGVRGGLAGDLTIETEHGDLGAGTVVLATGTPILDRGGFFARLTAQRSCLAALRLSEPIPREMYLSAGQPTRSLRYAPTPDGDVLLVGGNGHPVGRARSERAKLDELVSWAQTWFPTAELVQEWSAQDYSPVGELPYVGPLLPGRRDILVGTGYAKWGLTNGVAAALALAGQITGEQPGWSGALASWRPDELKALPSAVLANSAVAQRLTTGWLRMAARSADRIPEEGRGVVRRHGVRPTAACTVDGVTTELSAVCPHLYGIVRWNDAERSWDCPLHGSRFAPDGTPLEGPATEPLTPLHLPRP